MQLAQLVGDGEVAAYVSEADRRRQVEHSLGPPRRPLPSFDGSRAAHTGERVVEHAIQGDRFTPLGGVSGALEGDQGPARELRQTSAGLVGDDAVVGPVHDHDRAAHLGTLLLHGALADDTSALCQDQGLAGGAAAPPREVLEQLRRVLLGHQLVEEEVEEPRIVAKPGVPVVAAPVRVVTGVLPPQVERGLPLGRKGGEVPDGRCDRDPGGDPLRVVGREVEGVQVAHREGDHHGPIRPGRVQHVEGVLRLLGTLVGRAFLRAVGLPVATWVEGDHPGTTRQERDLQLPDLGRHDAPGREQQDRRVLGSGQIAVHLPGDAYAVTLDVSRGVGLACLHGRLLQHAGRDPGPDRAFLSGRLATRHTVGEVGDGVVHDHRVASLGQMTGAREHEQLGPGKSRHVYAAGEGLAQVVGAVDDEDGARDRGQRLRDGRRVVTDELGRAQRDHHLAVGLTGPVDDVLVELRAVRVVADLGEEPPRERRPVAPPDLLVVELPAPRVGQVRAPGGGHVQAAVVPGRPVDGARGDRHHPGHAGGMPCRGQQPVPRTVAEPHQQRPVDADGVHDREQVAHGEQVGVVLRAYRPVAEAVPARVDDHHPVVSRQVGHLGLPHPGIDDRVGRREDDRVRAVAVDLVVDAHAVALDVRRGVGLPCLHCFLPDLPVPGPARFGDQRRSRLLQAGCKRRDRCCSAPSIHLWKGFTP